MLFSDIQKLKLGDQILLTLLGALAVGEEILSNLDTPRDAIRSLYTTAPKFKADPLRQASLRRAFLRLLEKKFVNKKEGERKERYRLTENGFAYLRQKFPELKLKHKKFDGCFRFVFYDIAESERKLRDQIRSGLRSLGFVFIQKSVWISPYGWEEEVENLFQKMKVAERAFIIKAPLPPQRTKELLRSYWKDLLQKQKRKN